MIDEATRVHGCADKAEVDAQFEHQAVDARAVAAQQDIAAVRAALQEARQQLRQQALPRRGGGSEPQRRLLGRSEGLQALAAVQDLACLHIDVLPLRRQRDGPARAAHEQRHAERLLQRADVGADGRLRQIQRSGRRREAGMLYGGHKGFQLLQVDLEHDPASQTRVTNRAGYDILGQHHIALNLNRKEGSCLAEHLS